MNKLVAVLAVLILSGLVVERADARTITFDASDYALGTNLSSASPGVTLSWLRQSSGSFDYNPTRHDVIAVACTAPCEEENIGLPVFGYDGDGPMFSTWAAEIDGYEHCFVSPGDFGCTFDGFSVLEMVFDSPTDRVSIDAAIFSDSAMFLAFDSSGLLLGCFWTNNAVCTESYTQNQFGEFTQHASVYRAQGDIARVVVGGFQGTSVIHEIRYNVPEPGTLALLGMGLAGLGFVRRRKSQ